ncbi:MAG TPA: tetratricopeptide repeat protein [Ktedonobacteraceae bacterium]|nr:tetratricopeptide repeat protein [Ktedonobacteraceae bacterium]
MDTPESNPQPRIRLTEARNKRHWSQQYVADQIGTTHVNISRWERGITRPGPYFRRKLCELFGKKEEELDLGPMRTARVPASDSSPPPAPITFEPSTVSNSAPATSSPRSFSARIFDPFIPHHHFTRFVGREDELKELKLRLCSGENAALTALNGLPGVGKTTLATAIAHNAEIQTYFSGGILWAGLGPEPDIPGIFSRWGSLFNISSSEIGDPNNIEAWGRALKLAIGASRMLVVIDDAWDIQEALEFRVGGPNCAYLLTTRFQSIANQFVPDEALVIRELQDNDSMQLLRMLAPKVIERDLQKTEALIHAVGGLPLALTLVGNYLRLQASTGVARHIDAALAQLSDAEQRLYISEAQGSTERHSSLSAGVPLSLKTVIAASDELLDDVTRKALYALSVFPPKPDAFSEEAALAVADCATKELDDLRNFGLIDISTENHYTLHQTIYDYARLHLSEQKDAEEQANSRLIVYVANFVERHKKAYEILETENAIIQRAIEEAAKRAKSREFIRIVIAYTPYLRSRGFYTQAEHLLQKAYNAAQQLNDDGFKAHVLMYLGEIAQKQGNYKQANEYLQRGLEIARELKDDERISGLLADLGWVTWKQGNYGQAEEYLREGLSRADPDKHKEYICDMLETLGSILASRGDYEQSKAYMQEALELAREIGDDEKRCTLLINLGVTEGEQGKFADAEKYFKEGLVVAEKIGHREWICLLLTNLGGAAAEQDHSAQAEQYFQNGLVLARELGQLERISALLLNLGLMTQKLGHYAEAEKYFQEGLEISRKLGNSHFISSGLYEYGILQLNQDKIESAEKAFQEMILMTPSESQDLLALARYGLARVAAAQGDIDHAQVLGNKSVRVLELIGHRNAREVRNWLCSIS